MCTSCVLRYACTCICTRAHSCTGALPVLLDLLSVGKAQTPAAYALANLAKRNGETQLLIASSGGIAPLLALLNGRNLDAAVQAASALAELARDNPDTQGGVAKAGGIRPLLALVVESRSPAAQSRAMEALGELPGAHTYAHMHPPMCMH